MTLFYQELGLLFLWIFSFTQNILRSQTYQLIINDGLTSESGKKLKEQVVKKFTTIGAQSDDNFFAQNYEAENDTDENIWVALGKTDQPFMYRIVNEDGELYSQDEASGTNEREELRIPPHHKLYISYTAMPTIKPSGEDIDIHFTTTSQSAIKPIILNKGESLKVAATSGDYTDGKFYIRSEEDGFLPYTQDWYGEGETNVKALKANELNELHVSFNRQMLISNLQDKPMTVYNVTHDMDVDIEKTDDVIKGITFLAPGESAAVTVRPEITPSSYIDLMATAFDELLLNISTRTRMGT